MWARVKGKTENTLLAMPFSSIHVFRPAMIQPLDGIRSRTANYRIIYGLIAPFLSAARHFWPNYISTTQELGKALLAAAKRGTGKRVIEAGQIREFLEPLPDSAKSFVTTPSVQSCARNSKAGLHWYRVGTRSRADSTLAPLSILK
jgi:hypothetical protein